jgi:hypothetical protein
LVVFGRWSLVAGLGLVLWSFPDVASVALAGKMIRLRGCE